MRTIIHRIIIIAATMLTFGADADFVTRSHPLTVDVEGTSVLSTLYLRFQVEEYGQPFEEFAKGDHDAHEAAFVAFVRALQSNDRAVAEKLYRRPVRAASQDLPATVSELSAADAVIAYRKAFGGMKDIHVVSRVQVGSKQLFVWQSNDGVSRSRNAFVVHGPADGLSVHGVTSNDPVAVLIVYDVMEAMRQRPANYRSVGALSTAFEVPLPSDGAQVALQFDGLLPGTDVDGGRRTASESGDSSAEVERLFAETADALRVGARDRFLSRFTTASGMKMKQYLGAVPETHYGAIPELSWEGRRVRFVAGSDPVRIVYYTIGDAPEYRYAYVVRDAATNELRFANVNRRWFLDHVLSRPDLFDVSAVIHRDAPAPR
jgi:hypothetical protein